MKKEKIKNSAPENMLPKEPEMRKQKLLLHSCCAPCSSSVISVLSRSFSITVFYFNPNIYPPREYEKRRAEQQRFLTLISHDNPIGFIDGDYDTVLFENYIRGLENCPEGGERCQRCFRLRFSATAAKARETGFSLIASTLSVSPKKNSVDINRIGAECAEESGVEWLFGDFKKKGGFEKSVALSKHYSLYRQNYCGCRFSKSTILDSRRATPG